MPRPRSDSRDRIIASARTLLRRQGYHGTGLAQIIEGSGAPRGSVYFLFPNGKEQIAAEAVNEWVAEVSEIIRRTRAENTTPGGWVEAMARHFAAGLDDSGFTEGFPVTTVALDSVPGSELLAAACRAAYDAWLDELAVGLAGYGVPGDRARDAATLTLASLEGAAVLCRVFRSTEPLERIVPLVRSLVSPGAVPR